MYIVTGGAGFIGSAFLSKLNQEGISDILVVDALGESENGKNLVQKDINDYWDKECFLKQLLENKLPKKIEAIVHLGACSSTTETDAKYMMNNNYRYTRALAEYALDKKIRFIYASSAATYGDGSLGFSDNHQSTHGLKPLNVYAYSKQLFDLWALKSNAVDRMVGLKFFNVFGPNEYHKESMRSVALKAFEQIQETGKVKLFKSYRPEYQDGEQKRDFVYVKDCCDVMYWFLKTKIKTESTT